MAEGTRHVQPLGPGADPRAGVPGQGDLAKEPPWSKEAEHGVLGCLLMDDGVFPLVGDLLLPRSFYLYEHQEIFTAISALVMDGKPADVVTVYEWLSNGHDPDEWGGLAYLNALAQAVPSTRNCRRYAELVAERYVDRQLIAGADEVLAIAWDVNVDVGARIERMVGLLSRVEQQRKNPGARVPLVKLAALREAAGQVRWLVKHVVPSESVGLMFGGSGTFKSFIAIDCALHVAHGLPWMGRKTTKGPVLYIAAEGGAGLWNRIDAWHRQRRLEWAAAELYVVPVAMDLAADAWRVVDAAQAVGVVPALVVVDTLSQTFTGEENSANDVAAYLREIGVRFRALWRSAVMVIHHSGHQSTERPRGSSAMKSNVDFMLGVHRDEKEMLATVSCEKQKDGELFRDAMFGLSVGHLGVDEDGDAVTSLVARHLGTEEEVQEAREREAAAGRGGRNFRFMQLVQNGMQETALRKAFYEEVVHGLDAEAKKKAYQRARQQAVDARLIEVAGGVVILLKGGQ